MFRVPILLIVLALSAAPAESAPRLSRAESVRLGGELLRAGRAEAASRQGFARARARLDELNAQEAKLAQRVGANRTALIRLLGALERWRKDPPPALVANPHRAVEAARAAILMQAAAPELERRAHALAFEVKSLNAVRRAAAQADQALFAAESEAAERRTVVDALAQRKAALDAALASPEERETQARARALAVRAGGLGPLAGELSARGSAPAGPPERLLPPVEGAPVRRYGDPWPGRAPSEGFAWSPPAGAPVLAPAAGVVEYAGPSKGWDLVLILRLPGEWRVVLAGLQTITAAPGATVAAGEPVGRMAAPGAARPRAHDLYVELRRGTDSVDPQRLFAAGAPVAPAAAKPASGGAPGRS